MKDFTAAARELLLPLTTGDRHSQQEQQQQLEFLQLQQQAVQQAGLLQSSQAMQQSVQQSRRGEESQQQQQQQHALAPLSEEGGAQLPPLVCSSAFLLPDEQQQQQQQQTWRGAEEGAQHQLRLQQTPLQQQGQSQHPLQNLQRGQQPVCMHEGYLLQQQQHLQQQQEYLRLLLQRQSVLQKQPAESEQSEQQQQQQQQLQQQLASQQTKEKEEEEKQQQQQQQQERLLLHQLPQQQQSPQCLSHVHQQPAVQMPQQFLPLLQPQLLSQLQPQLLLPQLTKQLAEQQQLQQQLLDSQNLPQEALSSPTLQSLQPQLTQVVAEPLQHVATTTAAAGGVGVGAGGGGSGGGGNGSLVGERGGADDQGAISSQQLRLHQQNLQEQQEKQQQQQQRLQQEAEELNFLTQHLLRLQQQQLPATVPQLDVQLSQQLLLQQQWLLQQEEQQRQFQQEEQQFQQEEQQFQREEQLLQQSQQELGQMQQSLPENMPTFGVLLRGFQELEQKELQEQLEQQHQEQLREQQQQSLSRQQQQEEQQLSQPEQESLQNLLLPEEEQRLPRQRQFQLEQQHQLLQQLAIGKHRCLQQQHSVEQPEQLEQQNQEQSAQQGSQPLEEQQQVAQQKPRQSHLVPDQQHSEQRELRQGESMQQQLLQLPEEHEKQHFESQQQHLQPDQTNEGQLVALSFPLELEAEEVLRENRIFAPMFPANFFQNDQDERRQRSSMEREEKAAGEKIETRVKKSQRDTGEGGVETEWGDAKVEDRSEPWETSSESQETEGSEEGERLDRTWQPTAEEERGRQPVRKKRKDFLPFCRTIHLHKLLFANNLRGVRAWLSNPFTRDLLNDFAPTGLTALHVAVWWCEPRIFSLLLDPPPVFFPATAALPAKQEAALALATAAEAEEAAHRGTAAKVETGPAPLTDEGKVAEFSRRSAAARLKMETWAGTASLGEAVGHSATKQAAVLVGHSDARYATTTAEAESQPTLSSSRAEVAATDRRAEEVEEAPAAAANSAGDQTERKVGAETGRETEAATRRGVASKLQLSAAAAAPPPPSEEEGEGGGCAPAPTEKRSVAGSVPVFCAAADTPVKELSAAAESSSFAAAGAAAAEGEEEGKTFEGGSCLLVSEESIVQGVSTRLDFTIPLFDIPPLHLLVGRAALPGTTGEDAFECLKRLLLHLQLLQPADVYASTAETAAPCPRCHPLPFPLLDPHEPCSSPSALRKKKQRRKQQLQQELSLDFSEQQQQKQWQQREEDRKCALLREPENLGYHRGRVGGQATVKCSCCCYSYRARRRFGRRRCPLSPAAAATQSSGEVENNPSNLRRARSAAAPAPATEEGAAEAGADDDARREEEEAGSFAELSGSAASSLYGLDLNAPDAAGRTALHFACNFSLTEAAKMLLHAGASPWKQQEPHWGKLLPLHACIDADAASAFLLLLQHTLPCSCFVNADCCCGCTRCRRAARYRQMLAQQQRLPLSKQHPPLKKQSKEDVKPLLVLRRLKVVRTLLVQLLRRCIRRAAWSCLKQLLLYPVELGPSPAQQQRRQQLFPRPLHHRHTHSCVVHFLLDPHPFSPDVGSVFVGCCWHYLLQQARRRGAAALFRRQLLLALKQAREVVSLSATTSNGLDERQRSGIQSDDVPHRRGSRTSCSSRSSSKGRKSSLNSTSRLAQESAQTAATDEERLLLCHAVLCSVKCCRVTSAPAAATAAALASFPNSPAFVAAWAAMRAELAAATAAAAVGCAASAEASSAVLKEPAAGLPRGGRKGESVHPAAVDMVPNRTTLVVTHAFCLEHIPLPEPADMPIKRHRLEGRFPENPSRLEVLISWKKGVLRTREFAALSWRADPPPAALRDILRVHAAQYVSKLRKKAERAFGYNITEYPVLSWRLPQYTLAPPLCLSATAAAARNVASRIEQQQEFLLRLQQQQQLQPWRLHEQSEQQSFLNDYLQQQHQRQQAEQGELFSHMQEQHAGSLQFQEQQLRSFPLASSHHFKQEEQLEQQQQHQGFHEYFLLPKEQEQGQEQQDASYPPPFRNRFSYVTVDEDTPLTALSWAAATHAAGAVTTAVDEVCKGRFRNAFCAVRPPGHHLGTWGAAEPAASLPLSEEDFAAGSQGFCLLNNVAIGAAYAKHTYARNGKKSAAATTAAIAAAAAKNTGATQATPAGTATTQTGIRRVAIVDFDIHHGNGTEQIIRNLGLYCRRRSHQRQRSLGSSGSSFSSGRGVFPLSPAATIEEPFSFASPVAAADCASAAGAASFPSSFPPIQPDFCDPGAGSVHASGGLPGGGGGSGGGGGACKVARLGSEAATASLRQRAQATGEEAEILLATGASAASASEDSGGGGGGCGGCTAVLAESTSASVEASAAASSTTVAASSSPSSVFTASNPSAVAGREQPRCGASSAENQSLFVESPLQLSAAASGSTARLAAEATAKVPSTFRQAAGTTAASALSARVGGGREEQLVSGDDCSRAVAAAESAGALAAADFAVAANCRQPLIPCSAANSSSSSSEEGEAAAAQRKPGKVEVFFEAEGAQVSGEAATLSAALRAAGAKDSKASKLEKAVADCGAQVPTGSVATAEAMTAASSRTPAAPTTVDSSITGEATANLSERRRRSWRGWFDEKDAEEVFFASIHAYDGAFYPGTGAECHDLAEGEEVDCFSTCCPCSSCAKQFCCSSLLRTQENSCTFPTKTPTDYSEFAAASPMAENTAKATEEALQAAAEGAATVAAASPTAGGMGLSFRSLSSESNSGGEDVESKSRTSGPIRSTSSTFPPPAAPAFTAQAAPVPLLPATTPAGAVVLHSTAIAGATSGAATDPAAAALSMSTALEKAAETAALTGPAHAGGFAAIPEIVEAQYSAVTMPERLLENQLRQTRTASRTAEDAARVGAAFAVDSAATELDFATMASLSSPTLLGTVLAPKASQPAVMKGSAGVMATGSGLVEDKMLQKRFLCHVCRHSSLRPRSILARRRFVEKIIRPLLEFSPDIIFVSAGFDGHEADQVGGSFGGLNEDDFAFFSSHLVRVAERTCNGRLVSVLEGGYRTTGDSLSTFAVSVRQHVRALFRHSATAPYEFAEQPFFFAQKQDTRSYQGKHTQPEEWQLHERTQHQQEVKRSRQEQPEQKGGYLCRSDKLDGSSSAGGCRSRYGGEVGTSCGGGFDADCGGGGIVGGSESGGDGVCGGCCSGDGSDGEGESCDSDTDDSSPVGDAAFAGGAAYSGASRRAGDCAVTSSCGAGYRDNGSIGGSVGACGSENGVYDADDDGNGSGGEARRGDRRLETDVGDIRGGGGKDDGGRDRRQVGDDDRLGSGGSFAGGRVGNVGKSSITTGTHNDKGGESCGDNIGNDAGESSRKSTGTNGGGSGGGSSSSSACYGGGGFLKHANFEESGQSRRGPSSFGTKDGTAAAAPPLLLGEEERPARKTQIEATTPTEVASLEIAEAPLDEKLEVADASARGSESSSIITGGGDDGEEKELLRTGGAHRRGTLSRSAHGKVAFAELSKPTLKGVSLKVDEIEVSREIPRDHESGSHEHGKLKERRKASMGEGGDELLRDIVKKQRRSVEGEIENNSFLSMKTESDSVKSEEALKRLSKLERRSFVEGKRDREEHMELKIERVSIAEKEQKLNPQGDNNESRDEHETKSHRRGLYVEFFRENVESDSKTTGSAYSRECYWQRKSGSQWWQRDAEVGADALSDFTASDPEDCWQFLEEED